MVHSMAEIHGWIWMLVGLFVLGTSLYIGNLRFFVLLGSAFIAWGAFKLVRDAILPEEKPRPKPWERPGDRSGPRDFGGAHSVTASQAVQAVPCPACRTMVWSTAHFCHFCGVRLKNP